MRVEMLNVGWISSPAMIWRQGEDPERQLRFPIPAYLVETDTERVLIDTGLNPEAVRDTAAHYGAQASFMTLELERSVAEQIDVSTLTRVVLTHLHFDHVGGLALLPPEIPIVVQRREWEGGRDGDAIRRNFFYPRDYELDGRRVELIDGDHDLFGDGSVELLLTPGHTPGHQSVRIGEQLVLGADVTHFAATLDDLRFPSFADDFDAQARSAGRLRAMRENGVTVMPGHDPDVLAPGPLALS
jgi:glyoxylase-like metal-dependent hydrolase (beta-lactamase superfamily II)